MARRYTILILVLSVYALQNVFRPGGLMAYVFPSICWSLLALATLAICGLRRIRLWFNRRIFLLATLIAILQIVALVDAGLFTGFSRSPYSFTRRGLMINSIFVLSALIGTELSRACLMKDFGMKRPFLTLGLVTLLYSFMDRPVVGYLGVDRPLLLAEFLGTSFLPTLSKNLLVSYLALLGGPFASIAYRGCLEAFKWFCPVLPDLPWGIEALLGVLVPSLGFIIVSQFTNPRLLRRLRIPTETKRSRRSVGAKGSSARNWTIISALCVLIVWTATGLLGISPTVVLSGSMRPTMEIGDIAVSVERPIDSIKPGDIIQYSYPGGMTIHRVVEIGQLDGPKFFITKGDAEPTLDPRPVTPSQVRGKVVLTLPKLGWLSIHTKTVIKAILSFYSAHVMLGYATLAFAAFMASMYAVRTYKSRKIGRRRRLHGVGGRSRR